MNCYRVEEELRRRSMGDLDADARRSTSSARRSFFKRKKHQRSSSRDSKELASFSTGHIAWLSSNSGSLYEETALYSYQRVEQLNCKFNFLETGRYDCFEISTDN